ncbi:hypothetical protein FRC11_004386 [Ceratobasidium sp. 423]|nr:hypothetical protein FRC11_004386 [Ceratobasidium sp. 423]
MSQPGSEPSNADQRPVVHEGHTGIITSVVFSADGKSVVSGSQDRSIRIWDASSPGSIGRPLTGHSDWVNSVSYSPLGNMIASGSSDSTIRLWDPNTGQQVGAPIDCRARIFHSIAFSPDANLIASDQDNGGHIRLWSVSDRTAISRPFRGHSDQVLSVSFSPDGTRLVSGSRDWTVRIWDVQRAKTVIGPLEQHTFGVSSVSYSPDGSQIASASYDHTIRLWDARTGAEIGDPLQDHADEVYSISFSPNGRYISSGGYDGKVCVWDVRARRQANEPFLQHSFVRSVAFSPCGTRIASSSDDQNVWIWNLSGSDLDTEHGRHAITGDNAQKLEVETEQFESENETETIDQHMSIQEMFDLLVRHGCADLASQMDINQETAVLMSGGGFGDIWKGKLHNGVRVAIKAWRAALIEQCDYKSLKRATREIHYWSKMKHEHVHQLMGVILFKGQALGMVSEWMVNGNLHEYLQKNPKTDRLELSLQVASGLAYVHKCSMVHGDVKAFNVLVSSDGVARLTDFGLSTMSESSLEFSATTTSQAGSIRWAAPELLTGDVLKSKQSDIYALGMEIFTGTVPYSEIQRDYQIIRMIDQGILPTRPMNELRDDEHGNGLWAILVNCWDKEPDARPTAEQTGERLAAVLPSDL